MPVWPHRYMYGNYWNTVANVDASDIRWRCIGKVIARDLRLVASRLYKTAVTRPGLHAAMTLSPSLGTDLLGCIISTREKERKARKAFNNHAGYVLVQAEKSRYRLAPYGSLSVDPAHGETPPSIDWDPEVVKPVPTPFIPGRDPKKLKVWRTEEKRWNRRKERPIDNFPPVLSSQTLLTHYLRFRASDFNSSISPLRNSYIIWPAIGYRTRCSCISALVIVGICQGGRASAHDLASMGASAASIGHTRQSYMSIACSLIRRHLTRKFL
jgi:hypothetical protein